MDEIKALGDPHQQQGFGQVMSTMRQRLSASDRAPWPEGSQCPRCGWWLINIPGVKEAIDARSVHPNRYQLGACKCERQDRERAELKAQRLGNANLPLAPSIKDGEPMSFVNFTVEDGNKDAHSAAGDFVRGLSPEGILVITAQFGLGKTHLLAAIAREVVKSGGAARFEVVGEMLTRLQTSFGRGNDDQLGDLVNWYQSHDVLLLDDLGAERTTDWAASIITSIVDYRYRNNLRLVIATNLGRDLIEEQFGSRLTDRLWDKNSERVRRVYMQGESWRTR